MHTEMSIKMQKCAFPGPGKAELVYTAEDGTETRELIHNFTGAGVIQGMHNLDIHRKLCEKLFRVRTVHETGSVVLQARIRFQEV